VLRARNIDPEMLLCKAAEPSRPGRIHERKPQKRHREAPLALKRSLLLLSGINKANQGAIETPPGRIGSLTSYSCHSTHHLAMKASQQTEPPELHDVANSTWASVELFCRYVQSICRRFQWAELRQQIG
jgi:hypothetical protein